MYDKFLDIEAIFFLSQDFKKNMVIVTYFPQFTKKSDMESQNIEKYKMSNL